MFIGGPLFSPHVLTVAARIGNWEVNDNVCMALEFTTSYLADALTLFHYYKKMGEGAIAQVTDEELTATLDGEMNSIALIVKHMTGTRVCRQLNVLAGGA